LLSSNGKYHSDFKIKTEKQNKPPPHNMEKETSKPMPEV
jgi:hypothetical protein